MLTARCRTSKSGQGCDVCSPAEKKPANSKMLFFHERESLGMRITYILHNFQNFLFCHVG